MKKLWLLWLLTCCILAAWCWSKPEPVSQEEIIPQENIEEQNPTNTNELWENESYYSWNVTIAWIGPDISLEPTAEEWTLVLKWYFEDHTDHLFVAEWLYNCDSENGCIEWNTAFFEWIVEWVDGAAGNHYYNVKEVTTLSFEWNSNDTFECTEEEKNAEVCNLDYTPVCGDDWITYWNACAACASKQISSYKEWEC